MTRPTRLLFMEDLVVIDKPEIQDDRELVLSMTLDAPRADVWRCWTEPDLRGRWAGKNEIHRSRAAAGRRLTESNTNRWDSMAVGRSARVSSKRLPGCWEKNNNAALEAAHRGE
jgi:hypothetical protein